MFAGLFGGGVTLANFDESSMPGIIFNSLTQITQNVPSSKKELHVEAKKIMNKLQEDDKVYKNGAPYDTNCDKYFLPFKYACEVPKVTYRDARTFLRLHFGCFGAKV